MSAERGWTGGEFDSLLLYYPFPAESLARSSDPETGMTSGWLDRTPEEIEQLRARIHDFHTMGRTEGLTPLMLQRLALGENVDICAVCDAVIHTSIPSLDWYAQQD